MKSILKSLVKMLPAKWQNELRLINMKRKRNTTLEQWKSEGSPLPPPHTVKQLVIEEYTKKYKINTLVETGTYLGDMVMAQKNNFKRIMSIELGEDLWKQAKERFKMYNHIEILQGDSGKVLGEIIGNINERALFWLDGHYSSGVTAQGEKDCPIYEELTAIFSNNHNHIILIDDARHFVGEGDYPTVDALIEFVGKQSVKYSCEVKDDIIRFETV